jgi:hypothetical protein
VSPLTGDRRGGRGREDEEAPLKAMDEVARVLVLVERIEMGIAEGRAKASELSK